jgi:hypothetical protein
MFNWLKRRLDPKRCRYDDCVEQHPVAQEDERITCSTCRAWLGLGAA